MIKDHAPKFAGKQGGGKNLNQALENLVETNNRRTDPIFSRGAELEI